MLNKIKRGEIYYADLDPVVGSEQGGCRPIIVLQNDVGNQHSPTVIIAAITGKAKKAFMPTHYLLPVDSGLDMPSLVLLEQLRTIDKSRLRERVGWANETTMKGIDRAIAVSMGLKI